MQYGKIFFLILLVFICFNVAVVSASDLNSTDNLEVEDDSPIELDEEEVIVHAEDDSNGNNESVEKDSVNIEVTSTNVKSRDNFETFMVKSRVAFLYSSSSLKITVNLYEFAGKSMFIFETPIELVLRKMMSIKMPLGISP